MQWNALECTEMHWNAPKCIGMHRNALECILHRWIVELTSLGACISYGHPHLLKAIQSGSLDRSQAPVQQLSDMFYADVLVRMHSCALANTLSCTYLPCPART